MAIESGDRSVSYGDLLDLAEQIRGRLAQIQKPGGVVAVCGHRSVEVIAASLAVWSTAATLMLIDDSLPQDRQALMLECVAPGATITCGSEGSIAVTPTHQTGVDSLPPIQADWTSSETDYAYIAFTSGSTGLPKAILGSHKGLSHFLQWQRNEFGIGPSDRFAHFTNLSFDVWFRDAFTPLISGATLCIPESLHLGARDLFEFLATQAITALHVVPSVANHWINSTPSRQVIHYLRLAFFAGEPLEGVLVRRWTDAFPACQVVNLYGPTETTLAKHFKRISSKARDGIQAVGHPIPGSASHILDEQLLPCADGVQGEICIETPHRSHGYLTADGLVSPFIQVSLAESGTSSIYRTGDIGLRNQDGDIEILGRKDDQVKINGVRIELLEVKSVMASYPGVRDVFVCTTQDRYTKSIVAIVESDLGIADKLSEHLRRKLPAAMVPARILTLGSLPRLPNGKINRPELTSLAARQAQAHAAPVALLGASVSDRLENIWKSLLGLSQMDHHRNFFESGGNSLSIVELHARMEEEFKIRMPLVRLFEYSSVDSQADLVAGLIEGGEAATSARPTVSAAGAAQRARIINARLRTIRQTAPRPQFAHQEENTHEE